MRVIDVINDAWAIMPEKLIEISGIYATHLRGDKIDLKGIEAMIGRPLENREQGYEVVGSTAIIPVQGVIGKKMNLMHAISGGVSTELLARDFAEAMSDERVKSIVLDIDSPGGSVDGTEDIAKIIHEARGSKPIVALASGLMASAAYWIGAAADRMYISNKTTAVGSIGVVATHGDYSEQNARDGVKITEITAGKFKRIPSENEALTAEGLGVMQDRVDYIYSVFVGDVAKFKGVSVETVIEKMADGRVFLGQQAIDAGLVEGVMTMNELVSMLDLETAGVQTQANTIETKEVELMNIKDIQENHPDLAKDLVDQGKASVDTASIAKEAAAAELKRIQDVQAQALPGHEDLINALAYDGLTTGPEAAVKVLAAEKLIDRSKAADIKSDAADIPNVEPDFLQPKSEVSAHAHLPLEDRCKAEWKENPGLRAEFGDDFGAYFCFQEADAEGLIKIQGAR